MNWRMVFVLFAVYAVGTNALIMAGIVPAIAEGLNTSEAVAGLGLTVFSLTSPGGGGGLNTRGGGAGLGLTVFSLTYAVVGPLLPIVLARFGRRTIMAAG